MIEPDINERMARFAPSQNMGDPGDDAVERAVAGMAGMPARPQFEQDDAIDSAVLQIAGERKQDMAASLMAASQVNPDQAARASRLGEQFGVGQDIALRNMQELEREAAVRDIQRRDLMRNDPVLARYLSDRAFASEAQDDVGMLAMLQPLFMEAAMIQTRGAPALFDAVSRGYQRGKKQMELGEMQALGMVQYPTPQERDDMANLTKEIQELGRGGAIGTGAEMIGQYAANLKEIAAYSTAGAAIGSVVPGAGTAAGGALGLAAGLLKTTGTTAAGKLYNTLYEKGVPDDVAIPAAIAGGFFSGLVEVVGGKIAAMPVQALAKRVMAETLSEALTRPTLQQAAKEFVKAYGLQVGGETFEEGTQAISDMLSEEIALAASGIDSELTLREGFMTVIESALYGAAGSAILGGIGPGANLLVDLRRASNTERQTKVFEDLATNRKESKYANRNPVGYERFLASQAEGTTAETIYVDGRIAQQVLAQSGVPVAQLEEILPGIRERIAEAVETGGDVTIPTARFGAKLANTGLGNALLPHMRLSPDAMSATEAQEFATRRQEVVREAEQILAQKQETDATFVQQARQIEDTLTSQIVATGQIDERAARSSAQFMRDFYVTQAAALGISPQEVYERFPVRVQGEQAAQTVAPSQVAPQPQASVPLAETETKPLQTSLGELSARTEEHNARMANEGREESHPQAKAGRALKDSVRRLNDAINANDETEIAHQAWRLRNRLETLRQNLDANAIAAVEAMLAKLDAFMQQRGIEIHNPIGEKYVDGWEEVEVVSWEEVTEKNPEPDTIKQTIRPIIRRNGKVASRGQVIATYATEADLKRHEEKQAQRKAELLARAESRQAAAPLGQTAPVLEQAAISRMNADYMAAVERGDTETQQRLVNEAAEIRMPNSKVRVQDFKYGKPDETGRQPFVETLGQLRVKYHGGKAGVVEFTGVLDRKSAYKDKGKSNLHNQGIWLAGSSGTLGETADMMSWANAATYANNYLPDAEIYSLFVNITNPKKIGFEDAIDYTVEQLKSQGYDGAYVIDTGAWVAFSPEQVKRADAIVRDQQGNVVPLSRRFDLTSPRIFEQAPVAPGFYSALEREVGAIDAKALTASGWGERFKGLISKGAIKADELEWSGLNDYLKMQEGKVSKDTVLEFLRGNGVRVEQVDLGSTGFGVKVWNSDKGQEQVIRFATKEQANQHIEKLAQQEVADLNLRVLTYDGKYFVVWGTKRVKPFADDKLFNTQKQAEAELVKGKNKSLREARKQYRVRPLAAFDLESDELLSEGATKYERYTLPGGTNDREVLLTLPSIPNAPEFTSSHWNQRNVLVHLRMNDRTDADGKRVLFVEEVQSDWGQAGVKRGFVNQRAADEAELADLSRQQEGNPTDARKKQIARIQERLTKDEYNIARAPYVETTDGWLNLGLKQIMLEAVRGGYDSVAFVSGQQSADRYDLSKRVESIVFNKNMDGTFNYQVTLRDTESDEPDGDNKTLEQIEETFGKEIAQKMDAATPADTVDATEQEDMFPNELSGLDLKVGGEGMQNFYNKIVPTAMGKLLKKYGGGKLNDVVLPNMKQQEMEADAERMGMNVADVLDLAEDTEYAQAQPGFDITPELIKKLESGLPLFQAMPAAGPARGGFDPSRLTTILNKTADLSTFLHESAHAFLTFYEQMSRAPNAPARIVNDMDELLRWFGIAGATPAERIANWNGMSLDQKRKYHETFAYNFEVYLFEGKAPSAEMQGMFERFGAWLKRVYKSIRDDLNAIYRREFGEDLPILTGEVRQVMDRMLATDEQIKRQAAINEMKPHFQTQEQSGMDDAEWAAHQAMQQEAIEASVTDMNKASMRQLQWLGNARSRILRDMQRKHEAKRKEVAAEVAAAVRVEPLYRAMTYLRTGKFIDTDGAEVVVEGPHRLDIKRVQAIYAGLPSEKDMEAVRATGMAMPKVFAPDIAKLGTGKFGMIGVDGLDPDVVAESFGYSSGDQMIRALLEAKPIKEAVAERTDAEMLRRYGDMNTPEAQEAEVQKALHNEARGRVVAVELRHIARATQPVRVMLEAAKQVARELIAGMTLRDVRPGDFIAAEARAARDASRMGATVNPEAIGRAAYTRIYNERIAAGADEATAVAEATTAATEAARKAQERSDALKAQYGADPQQALIRAKRAQLYQNQLAAQALAVREEVAKQIKYLRRIMRDTNVKAMGAQAADQIAALLERFEVAPVSLKRLDERKALAAWLAEQEAAGLVPDIAPEVADEARRVNYQQLTVTEFRNLVDAIRQIEFIGKNERKVQLAAERAAFEEKRDEIVTRIRAVGRLRGVKFDPRSPLTNIGRAAAALRGFAAQHLKAASVARILDGGEDDGPLWQFAIRSANAAADMETRMRAEASAKIAEILAPVFKLGNMGGKGVFFPSIKRSLNREARIAIAMNVGNDGNRQRLLDGEGWTMEQIQPILESLTEAEWNAVQQVWDYIDTYRPLIAEKERRLYGKEPQWVTPVPMSVRTADGKTVNLTGGYYPIKYDPIASDRVATVDEAAEAKRALDGAYTAATTRRSFVKQRAKEVVGRPLLYTLDAAFGGINDVIHDLSWHEWLIQTQRLLRDPEFANAVRETRGPEFLKQLRDWAKDNAAGERKIGVAGEAALSWLRQGISASGLGFNVVSAAMQITGFNQSIVRLGAKYVGRGVAQFAASPIDTARMVADKSSFMAERGRTQFREINEIRNRVRGQTEVARRVTAGTYFLMMNMQRTVDIPTWLAGYQKALDAGKDDATAVALADQAVRDTQGSGLISDLAAIERGGPMMNLFTVFYSYMNTVYNMTAVQTMTARGKGKLAADYAMLLVVPVVLGQAIKNLIQPDAGDDELDPEALARKLAAEELSFLMGTMVIAREFGGAAQLLTGAEGVRMGYGGPAGLRAVGEVYGLATQAGQLDFDRAFRRSAINTLGAFTGLPSAQVNRTIDGIEAVIEGEVEGVGAVVAPLTGVQR